MGAYLSEPVTEKLSSDEVNEKLDCGASSMQGWRVNQEDAHNTILDFDVNTSLFAVYDGHGGAEVATYCSRKLPDYIKNTEAYKNGDYMKALENAFLGFDASIASKEVMAILKEIAGQINPPCNVDKDDSDEEENVSNLFQEARQPLQEVLAKYEISSLHRARLAETTPLSPCLRAKKSGDDIGAEEGASSSSVGESSDAAGSSSAAGVSAAASSSSIDEEAPAPSQAAGEEDAGVSSTNSTDPDKDTNGVVSTSELDKPSPMEDDKPIENTIVPDSSEDNNRVQPEQSECATKKPADREDKSEVCNGEVSESKAANVENNISSSNGEATPVKSGKAKDKTSGVSSTDKPEVIEIRKPKKAAIRRAAAAVYKSLLMQGQDDDDESDSNDETFEGAENSSDEENVNGVSDSSNEGEGEEEDGEEEEEEDGDGDKEECSSEEEFDDDMNMQEEPGNDSGCTAVVALLKGNELYVANAGDSRCIVCREGKAVDMSLDHKPEDVPELERITKAGGKVSCDGRINGGLNLSRAIGDHSYKQNKELDAKEQMITALPDVKTLTIDPEKDEFMVLACDGIWNFMSSQDVCDFILPRLTEGRERLSQICEEMFDHCLAPSTVGDGTGCDNMTAIVIRFKKGLVSEVAQHSVSEGSKKRTADEVSEEKQDSKRQKVEDSLSSSLVTSSV